MLKYYRVFYITFLNNEEIISYCSPIIQEEEAQDKKFLLNWNNVEEMSKKFGACLGFSIWKKRKGRVIEFSRRINDIKEWKTKELNLSFEIHFKKVFPSIAEILKYSDAEKAIKYLDQFGLKLNLTEAKKVV